MIEKNTIFSEDIEVPEIVTRKAEAAFAKINMEGISRMNKDVDDKTNDFEDRRKQYQKKRRLFKSQAAVIVGICFFAAGSITVVAAIHHLWSRGMQGTLQASEVQQEVLIDQGVANVITDSEDYTDLAVTSSNVTVAPETVIVDGKFAYISFSIKGYSLGENEEPSFEYTQVELADTTEDNFLNMNASFYDGSTVDDAGNLAPHFADEDGELEYIVQAFVTDLDESLLGKKVHVVLENLGTINKAEYSGVLEGKWEFTISLSDVSAAKEITVAKNVEGTMFTLNSLSISPISIQMNYSVNGKPTIKEDEMGVPDFRGVILRDGTRLQMEANGVMTGYTDDSLTSAYVLSTFNQVIDPEQVTAILVRTQTETDLLELPIE